MDVFPFFLWLGDTETVEFAFSFWNTILGNFGIYIYW